MKAMPKKYWSVLLCHGTAAAAAFMILPVLSLYLYRNFKPVDVSYILTAQVLITRLLPLFLGSLGDVISRRNLVMLGLLMQGVGLISLALVNKFFLLLTASVVIGIGNVLYDLGAFLLFANVDGGHKESLFVRSNMMQNVGSILGPAIGSSLYLIEYSMPFVIAGLAMLILPLILLKSSIFAAEPAASQETTPIRTSLSFSQWKPIFHFALIMSLWWMIFAQVIITFPLEAARRTGSEDWGGYILSISGSIVVISSAILAKFVTDRWIAKIIIVGSLAASMVFFVTPLYSNIGWFVLCIGFYSIIESLLLPASEVHIANLIGTENQGKKRSIYRGISGLGMVAGTFLGPQIFSHDTLLTWIVCGVSAGFAALAFGIWNLLKRSEIQTSKGKIL